MNDDSQDKASNPAPNQSRGGATEKELEGRVALGAPYPTADEHAYATWFDGPVERWLAEQKARGEPDPRGL